MAEYKVVLEREECTSCEACVESCPESFEMSDDGFAHLKGSSRVGDDRELNPADLGCCPRKPPRLVRLNIIHIFEGEKQII